MTASVWHPQRKILAVGWETGEITLWNEQDRELVEAPHLHRAEVTVMAWSSHGTRLISADTVRLMFCLICSVFFLVVVIVLFALLFFCLFYLLLFSNSDRFGGRKQC